jgi:SP family general alpha glucoside:H+ symporter-like MFS transporter
VHLEKHEAYAADEAEHKLTMGQAFKAYYKAVIWSATLSMALVMESYGTPAPVTYPKSVVARFY